MNVLPSLPVEAIDRAHVRADDHDDVVVPVAGVPVGREEEGVLAVVLGVPFLFAAGRGDVGVGDEAGFGDLRDEHLRTDFVQVDRGGADGFGAVQSLPREGSTVFQQNFGAGG